MPNIQDVSASLCFRGQQIFLHNAHGCFGDVPLEASGDFGIHPDEGEFHVMCQVSLLYASSSYTQFLRGQKVDATDYLLGIFSLDESSSIVVCNYLFEV